MDGTGGTEGNQMPTHHIARHHWARRWPAVAGAAGLVALAALATHLPGAQAQTSPVVVEVIGEGGADSAPVMGEEGRGIRLGTQMAALDSDTIVLFGGGFQGEQGESMAGDTWLLEGDTWTPVCGTNVPGADQPCGPAPRILHAMGHAPGGGVVLYGGSNSLNLAGNSVEIYADTWIFDGATWEPVCGTTTPGADHGCGPGPRAGATMLESLGGLFVFAGGTNQEFNNDTWSFEGGDWAQVHDGSAQAPPPRVWSQTSPYGGGDVIFGGVVESDAQAGSAVYSPSPSPLRSEARTYLASASPLSWNGNDYSFTGPAGGSGSGSVLLAAGEWYQAVSSENQPVQIPTGAPTGFDVALVRFGSGQRGTVYLESTVFDQYGFSRNCAGANSVLSTYNDGSFTASCENFAPSILTQTNPGTSFAFGGYGPFEFAGPVTEVNDPAWTPGTDPFINAGGTVPVDHQGPCCGQPDPGAMFKASDGDPMRWIAGAGVQVYGLDAAGPLSPVHVGLISVNGADITVYVARDVFVGGNHAQDCGGLIAIFNSVSPQADPVGCRNFKRDVFVPNAPGQDYSFTGFGGFDLPGAVSETPTFAADGAPTLAYVDGGNSTGGRALVPDTWLWDPPSLSWTPVCGTTVAGADQACGPTGRAGGAAAPITSSDASLNGALMASGLVPGEGPEVQFLGDIWLFAGGNWQQLSSPWQGVTLGGQQPSAGQPVPLGMAADLLARECRVEAIGFDTDLLFTGQGFDPATQGTLTLALGFDTTGEGEIDPCPAPSSAPDPGSGPGQGLAFTGASRPYLPVLAVGAALLGSLLWFVSLRRLRNPATPRRSRWEAGKR